MTEIANDQTKDNRHIVVHLIAVLRQWGKSGGFEGQTFADRVKAFLTACPETLHLAGIIAHGALQYREALVQRPTNQYRDIA